MNIASKNMCMQISKSDSRSIIPDPNTLNRQLREGLQQVCSNAVGPHVLSHCLPSTVIEEGTLQSYIPCHENAESVEEGEAGEIFYSIRDNFVFLHNIQTSAVVSVDPQLVSHY